MRLPTRNVLITGGNRGIGLGVARTLRKRGWRVFITARKHPDLEATLSALNSDEDLPNAEGLILDVCDESSIRAAADILARSITSLEVLYNNAGIHPNDGDRSIMIAPPEQFVETFVTNCVGAVLVTRAFMPLLAAASQARVINVSSGLGQMARDVKDVVAPYSVSKSALNAVTLLQAKALAPRGITVVSTCPGHTKTDMGGPNAPRSLEEGVDTLAWLADGAPHDWTGVFVRDRAIQPW